MSLLVPGQMDRNDHLTSLTLIAHVETLRASYHHWTGKHLIDPSIPAEFAANTLDTMPFALVSHDTAADPVFNYANRLALELFSMSWDEFTALPSRLSAEPVNQTERARLLETVSQNGYIEDYSGIRIAKTGRRFMIKNATVWNLITSDGSFYGQAALIRAWQDI